MSETKKSDGEGKLRLKAPRRIVLKKTVEGGSIKQAFSHGRSKSVVVEVRRKKTFVKAAGDSNKLGALTPETSSAPERPKLSVKDSQKLTATPAAKESGAKQQVLRPLSAAERAERAEQKKREAEEQAAQVLEAKRREEAEEAARKAEEEEAAAKKAEEEEAAAKKAEEEEAAPAVKPEPPPEESARMTEEDAAPEKMPTPTADTAAATAAKPAGETRTPESEPKKATTDPSSGNKEPKKEVTVEVVVPEDIISEENEAETEKGGRGLEDPDSESAAEEELVTAVPAKVSKDEGKSKKKLTRAQREELARKKTEALVAKRLSQLDELRKQKKVIEERLKNTKEEGPARVTLKTKVKRKGKKAGAVADKQVPVRRGGKSGRAKGGRKVEQTMPLAPVVRDVIVPDAITVGDLANRMAVKSSEVIKLLMTQGMMVTINQVLDQDTAVLVVEELGHRPKQVSEGAAIDAELAETEDQEEEMITRAPVVTVMGHVDHGKTSLLDAIRQTDVTSREFGGITQHIGAYQVTLQDGGSITFLDTPGHAAFTAMRARGAGMTDLVVLVVAADDGVMPQTLEAIDHAKAAKVPIVVAVNKIDKPDANPDRIMQQLADKELIPEDWGGDTIFVQVSAKTGEGIDTLEEMILLQAEMLNLRTNVDKKARGHIVEAKLDKGRGPVATCLVQSGTLRVGDIFIVGSEWGKIRGLVNDKGQSVTEALPATPVEIIGLSGVPEAGDDLITVPDERRAKEIAAFRIRTQKEQEQALQSKETTDDIFSQIKRGDTNELKVVIKGDVRGSVEAVADALLKIKHEEIQVNVIHTGVGGINESDIMLAMASDALVLGFNVRADAKARELAKRERVDLQFYTIIYDLVDNITKAMEGQLKPGFEETILGRAEVREVFRISNVGNVAGCMVIDGTIQRRAKLRLLRDEVIVHTGKLLALKRFKDDAKEVREGMECGISLEKFNDLKAGDILEAFVVDEVRRTIG